MISSVFFSRRGGIGDLILFTPTLTALKKYNPNIKIAVLVDDKMYPLAHRMADIDFPLLYSKKLKDNIRQIKTIWRYDLAMMLETSSRGMKLARLAAVGKILPYQRNPEIYTTYEAENFIYGFEGATGINLKQYADFSRLDLPALSADEQEYAAQLLAVNELQHKPFIAVTPFTAWQPREWPVEYYAELIRKLNKSTGMAVAILGGNSPYEAEKTSWLKKHCKFVDLTGKTDFFQMCAVLKRAQLLVSSCTGSVHAAAALGIKSVVFYGPSSMERFLPRHNAKGLFLNYPCSPCNEFGACAERKCLFGITPEMAFSVCAEMLGEERA